MPSLVTVVALKAEVTTEEDRAALTIVLFYLREPRTGVAFGDIMRRNSMIKELVETLGLRTNLAMSQGQVRPKSLDRPRRMLRVRDLRIARENIRVDSPL